MKHQKKFKEPKDTMWGKCLSTFIAIVFAVSTLTIIPIAGAISGASTGATSEEMAALEAEKSTKQAEDEAAAISAANDKLSIDDIEDGATVAIANDGSNLARSLGVLQQQGLVTLKGEVDATKATVNDIASNPKNLKIKTIDAAQLARSLGTVDVALVPGNYSWAADLKPADALAMEKQDDGVIEVFVVRTQDVDSDFGKAVKKLLASQKFKDAIAKSEFKDFGKPTTW